MIDTRQKILETAERLFATQGLEATSLRQIIGEAGVNLAAIHYHFGSKEDLLAELIGSKAKPVNEMRLARLAQLEAEGDHDLLKILKAWMLPMADVAERNPQFVRVMGRIHAAGLLPKIVAEHFQPSAAIFIAAMRRAVPDLPDEEFAWRIHFMTGAMAHTMCVIPFLGPGPLDLSDFHTRIRRLIAFVHAGLLAPVPMPDHIEVNS